MIQKKKKTTVRISFYLCLEIFLLLFFFVIIEGTLIYLRYVYPTITNFYRLYIIL